MPVTIHVGKPYILAIMCVITSGIALPIAIDMVAQIYLLGINYADLGLLPFYGHAGGGIPGALLYIVGIVWHEAIGISPFLLISCLIYFGKDKCGYVLGALWNAIIQLASAMNVDLSKLVIKDDASVSKFAHASAIIISLSAIIIIYILFHWYVLMAFYGISNESSSTVALLFAFAPIYASAAVVYIYTIIGYSSMLSRGNR